MALNGQLGAVSLTTTSNTLLYDCPDGSEAWVTVNICCRSGSASVRLALTSGNSTPTDADWLEFDLSLSSGNAPLVREGIAMTAQDRLYVRSDTINVVNAVAYGDERSTS